MEKLEAKFRTGRVLAAASFAVAILGILLWLPPVDGDIGPMVRTDNGLTIFGAIIFVIASLFAMLGILLTCRAMFGMPALSFDGKFINVYVMPFYRIPLSQIEKIEIQSEDVKIRMTSGRTRNINLAFVQNHQDFFKKIMVKEFLKASLE